MKKKMLLSVVTLLLLPLTAWADAVEIGGIYYNLNTETKQAEVTKNPNKYSGEVAIPATVTPNDGVTYNVTTIGSEAFQYCVGLTSITIPNSVTSIGNKAFQNCVGLTSITIPNSVTSIGNSAFYSCSRLTSITIPNSVTSIGTDAFKGTAWYANQPDGLVYIDNVLLGYKGSKPEGVLTIDEGTRGIADSSFSGCSGLTSVTIPNSVTSIGGAAFYRCNGLTSITIGNSVTSIGKDAFGDCSGLTSVTIPNSVTSIGVAAFFGCSGLTSINIPNSVTYIGSSAFSGCSGLTSVTIGNSVTSIGDLAFKGCSSLTTLTIPNSVTSIGKQTFYNCSGLTSVTIGNSVTSIGYGAFEGCSSLTSVTIPNSVTSIGERAFLGCIGLTEVRSMIKEPFAISSYCWNKVNKEIPLYVPAGTKEKYEATQGWNYFTNIIEMEAEEETGEKVTVGNALVAGFSSNKALDFTSLESEGVSAWIATSFDRGNVQLSRVYRVPAGEGVYVKAEKAGEYEIPTTEEESFCMNMFVGVPNGAMVNMYEDFHGETYLTLSFAMSKTTGKPGFFPNTEPKTYGKNKMYLHMPVRLLPEYAQNDIRDFSLVIEFEDETTGISDASHLMDNGQWIMDKRGELFNLNGQRIDKPTKKGLYIIGDRKVFVK